MKLNLDNLNLQNLDSSAWITPRPTLSLKEIKAWWRGLSEEQMRNICKFEAVNSVPDLSHIAQNALRVCRFHNKYKKKNLIMKTEVKDITGRVFDQCYEFDLEGKDVVDNDLAKVFSCFYVHIAVGRDQDSYISVKNDKLEMILKLISTSMQTFSKTNRMLYTDKDPKGLFNLVARNIPKNQFWKDSLPNYLKALLTCLAAYAIVMENKICLTYYEQDRNKSPSGDKVDVKSIQPFTLNSLLAFTEEPKGHPDIKLMKTVSEVERENQEKEHQKKQFHSDDSVKGSTLDEDSDLEANISAFIEDKILEDSKSTIDEIKDKEVPKEEDMRTQAIRRMEEFNFMDAMNMYDGFMIGGLEMDFRPDDYVLTEEEGYVQQKQAKEDQIKKHLEILRKNDMKRIQRVMEQVDTHSITSGASSGEDKDSSDKENYDKNHNKKTSSSLGAHKKQIGNPRDFYPNFHQPPFGFQPHPPHFFMPPMMMNRPGPFIVNNQHQPSQPSQPSSADKISRDKSFDSHSSQDSEKDFISTKNFDPFHRGGYGNRQNAFNRDNQMEYYGNNNPRGYFNKDVPPRFQRKRGNLQRN